MYLTSTLEWKQTQHNLYNTMLGFYFEN